MAAEAGFDTHSWYRQRARLAYVAVLQSRYIRRLIADLGFNQPVRLIVSNDWFSQDETDYRLRLSDKGTILAPDVNIPTDKALVPVFQTM